MSGAQRGALGGRRSWGFCGVCEAEAPAAWVPAVPVRRAVCTVCRLCLSCAAPMLFQAGGCGHLSARGRCWRVLADTPEILHEMPCNNEGREGAIGYTAPAQHRLKVPAAGA